MTIETKFNIGDEVWFMDFGIVKSDIVISIIIECFDSKPCIFYDLKEHSKTFTASYEPLLYRTKQELLDSL